MFKKTPGVTGERTRERGDKKGNDLPTKNKASDGMFQ